ncbi:hypothetical protein [Anaerotignum sp.]|uniref:hypothetical protein n=1 Tax=Anaerotignum sp. TaxID=2039241 RepID=UPI002A914CB5|nr:hypothetical protein [Anaerotignum sp.]MCI7658135.1 hypothetical protein [Clostridia bacterium]MDY5414579.1 hypothetical protein [Anaerotignum sp.]
MATFTEHYDLIKPGTDDYYDVADFNENMDAIDTQLYQAERDMAGVSEKIGNPGDEGEDTLFGLLHPSHQPEEKADFYRYSKTDIKHQIQNWTAIPQVSGGAVWTYFKLLNVYAQKNGTIYVKLKATQQAIMSFMVLRKVAYKILSAPEKTEFKSMDYAMGMNFDYVDFQKEYVNSSSKLVSTENEWVFPVIAGVEYVFLLQANNATSLTVTDFSIGYTDTIAP